MRTLIRAGALTAGVSAALLLAPAAHATAPGDNGTVKIHDAKTGEELRRNEPHVCTFYLDAFGFDRAQQVDWHIEAWAPTAATKGETVKSGEITLDSVGHGRTEDLSLPDGHYKLFWDFEGKKGAPKHKVFWTDCKSEGGGGTTPSPSVTPSESKSPSESPSQSPSESESPSSSQSPSSSSSASEGTTASPSASSSEGGTAPSATASPSAPGPNGDLAETGSSAPVGLLSAAAAALVAAGGFLVLRRRKASRG
ncbi:MAG: LPXTG cell wall anchor domain-containing protein [Streptomyces sp.]|jgi:LPXTG-motif cell wall-anchored protein|nr:LPXTG cell wall anchor domain-containing protein [Streptomyces sp.]